MMHSYKISPRSTVMALLVLVVINYPALAGKKPELVVAISLDIPPYVMQQATSGLEIDVVRYALRDYTLRFIQLPYAELQMAVHRKRADLSVGVQHSNDGASYSVDFITFANYAISKKADGLKIDSISDLKNHRVLTWQGAYLELGDEFEGLFSPQSPQRENYTEVADQEEQVQMFWQGKGDVIVIDRSIFSHFSKALGRSMGEASLHPIFPPITDFKVSFNNPVVRDRFNRGLSKLCHDGEYAQLLNRYGVELQHTVCQ